MLGRAEWGKQVLKVVSKSKYFLLLQLNFFFTISSNSSDKSRDPYVLCNLQSISIC